MAVSNQMVRWSMQSSEALTDLRAGVGEIFKAVGATGAIAATGAAAIGILQQTADDAGHISLGASGLMKFTAGAAVTGAQGLTVTTSGYCIRANSGTAIVGRVMDVSVGSGAVGMGLFDFANPATLINCFGII